MTKLSVNINKIATLRNARGENRPDVLRFALDLEKAGAQGITVHPRPDERHITRNDVTVLKHSISTEFNIEGYPDARYMEIVRDAHPTQATLVPDSPTQLTSNAGWDVVNNKELLRGIVSELKSQGVRVSIFVDPDVRQVEAAHEVGADRVELYTKPYADGYDSDRETAVAPYVRASQRAAELGLGVNAGHDLDSHNLRFLAEKLPRLDEVSIGHALICEMLYMGLQRTVDTYLEQLVTSAK